MVTEEAPTSPSDANRVAVPASNSEMVALNDGDTPDLMDIEATESSDAISTTQCEDIPIKEKILLFGIAVIPIVVVFLALSRMFYGPAVYYSLVSIYKYRYVFYGSGVALLLLLHISDFPLVIRYNESSRGMTASVALFSLYVLLCGAIVTTKNSPHVALLVIVFQLPLFAAIARYTLCAKAAPKVFFRTMSMLFLIVSGLTGAIWCAWVLVPDENGHNDWWDADERARYSEDSKDIYKSYGDDIVSRYGEDVICRATGSMTKDQCANEDLSNYTLNYLDHCKLNARVNNVALDAVEELYVKKMCRLANTMVFVMWSGPFIAFLCTLAFSMVSFVRQLFCDVQSKTSRIRHLEQLIKTFILIFLMLIMCVYVAGEIAGASMMVGSIVLNFTGASFMCLTAWAVVSFRISELKELASKSFIISAVLKLPDSTWAQAMFILALHLSIFFYLGLDWVVQRIRSCQQVRFLRYQRKGYKYVAEARFTHIGTNLVRRVSSWHWADVTSKAVYIGAVIMLFFLGVTKITYIFLSWLNNDFLDSIEFKWILAFYFAIGLVMFLLPPVPGVPVYLVGGIIFGSAGACPCKGQDKNICNEVTTPNPSTEVFETDCVGFWPAIGIACVFAVILKLTAVVMQQKLIGELLGRSLYIKNLVGVHKPAIRAVEKLLSEGNGLTAAKVGILCGGPDWPTSVLTGILGLSLPQMLLGTLPCAFLITPCIISGALLLRSAQAGLWGPLSATTLTLASILQLLAMAIALFSIQDCIVKNMEELSRSRPEHAEVEALSRKQEEVAQHYLKRTTWSKLNYFQKTLIICVLLLLAFFAFGTFFLADLSFRQFSLTSRIKDLFSERGLEGNPLNIIKVPWGYLELVAFGLALILYWIFLISLKFTDEGHDSPASSLEKPGMSIDNE